MAADDVLCFSPQPQEFDWGDSELFTNRVTHGESAAIVASSSFLPELSPNVDDDEQHSQLPNVDDDEQHAQTASYIVNPHTQQEPASEQHGATNPMLMEVIHV